MQLIAYLAKTLRRYMVATIYHGNILIRKDHEQIYSLYGVGRDLCIGHARTRVREEEDRARCVFVLS